MNKYRVMIEFSNAFEEEILAENEEHARKKAHELVQQIIEAEAYSFDVRIPTVELIEEK
jgi:hypothetical protein